MSARRRGELSKDRALAHGTRYYAASGQRPWTERKLALLALIAYRDRLISPTMKPTARRSWSTMAETYAKDIARLVKLGLVRRTGSVRQGGRKTLNFVEVTEKGRALLAVQPVAHRPDPYAKRRAGMADFHAANPG